MSQTEKTTIGLRKVFMILAFVCFVLAMFPIAVPVSLVPLGLALWVLASLV